MIIDTHTHVAEACLLAPTVGAVERGYPILPVTDLLSAMQRHNVSKAVLVPWGNSFDHHYLAQCLAAYPGRFVAVCEVDHRRDNACQTLRCLVDTHGFRGIRQETTARGPKGKEFALWKEAANLGVVISASARSAEEFVAGLTEILSRVPAVPVRIEHLGRPTTTELSPSAFAQLLRLADNPHIYINLDGFYSHHYPDHRRLTGFPFAEYQPLVRQAVAAFGAERCLWGSEFPFLNNGYDAGLRFFNEACDFLSSSEREWILGKSAANLWRFEDSARALGTAQPAAAGNLPTPPPR